MSYSNVKLQRSFNQPDNLWVLKILEKGSRIKIPSFFQNFSSSSILFLTFLWKAFLKEELNATETIGSSDQLF